MHIDIVTLFPELFDVDQTVGQEREAVIEAGRSDDNVDAVSGEENSR